jgi:predicted PhzF superfamily epimerase YddE/YHI9
MPQPFFWVDAFTDQVFGGNPAGVIILDAWPADASLRRIAAENGLPATAFVVRTGPASARIRWFTPLMELELCGHATLATSFVLFTELGQIESPFTFEAQPGLLTVRRKGALVELDFPARPATVAEPPPHLIQGLGRRPQQTLKTDKNWLCIFNDEAEVRALRPDQAALGQVLPGRMIVSAPGDACDFVSRFFAPDAGIPEDSVTGSAHCTLVPYWADRLGKTTFHARQVSQRGGELWCGLVGDRVTLAGNCALYLKGQVNV